MRIAISAESTIDLPKDLLSEFDIHTVPFMLLLGEESLLDGEVEPEKMFEYTDKTGTLPKTSAVNRFQYEEHFGKLKEMGYDAIIHFSLSSGISAAYSNAKAVSEEMENVFVIDTKSLSTGIALQAIYARRLADTGKTPEEIVSLVSKRIPFDQASFSLESVNYLYKGGRCSMLSMLGANILHIKPEIIVKTDDGKMVVGKKFVGGTSKAVGLYVDDILRKFPNPDKELCFITYSTCEDKVLKAVRTKLEEAGFRRILETRAGGTISSHCGPHCLGILYFNDGEHPLINA